VRALRGMLAGTRDRPSTPSNDPSGTSRHSSEAIAHMNFRSFPGSSPTASNSASGGTTDLEALDRSQPKAPPDFCVGFCLVSACVGFDAADTGDGCVGAVGAADAVGAVGAVGVVGAVGAVGTAGTAAAAVGAAGAVGAVGAVGAEGAVGVDAVAAGCCVGAGKEVGATGVEAVEGRGAVESADAEGPLRFEVSSRAILFSSV